MIRHIVAYTCETITTIKIRNIPIIPPSFLMLLQSPSHTPNPYSQVTIDMLSGNRPVLAIIQVVACVFYVVTLSLTYLTLFYFLYPRP